MSITSAASRISPLKRPVSATHQLDEKWETMTPKERERYMTMLRKRTTLSARPPAARQQQSFPPSRPAGGE